MNDLELIERRVREDYFRTRDPDPRIIDLPEYSPFRSLREFFRSWRGLIVGAAIFEAVFWIAFWLGVLA